MLQTKKYRRLDLIVPPKTKKSVSQARANLQAHLKQQTSDSCVLCSGGGPPHIFQLIQVPVAAVVCVCVFEPLESLCKTKHPKEKNKYRRGVSCFGDSATHFHLKDERLLLLASAKVQLLR